MPTYEFQCTEHGSFESIRSITSDIPESLECPVCGLASNRVYSTFGISLKGGGYYSRP